MSIIAEVAAADIMDVTDMDNIDFWAAWCGPCRMISPVAEELAEQYEGKAKICNVNVDEEPELAAKFRMVAAIEKYHEERYRALLNNIKTVSVFEKSDVKVWECRNCGHIVVGTKAPEACPV